MILIKITIIIAIIYGVLRLGLRTYINQLTPFDKLRVGKGKYTKKEKIFFSAVGLMQLLLVISAAVSLILLVIKYL